MIKEDEQQPHYFTGDDTVLPMEDTFDDVAAWILGPSRRAHRRPWHYESKLEIYSL